MPKKRFAVYARTKRIVHEGLQTGKGHREFRVNKSLMNISDEGEAKEIEDKYGMKGSQDVFVVNDERYAHALNGEKWEVKEGSKVETLHHYTFGPTQEFENAWEEFEKRRKLKEARKRRGSAEVNDGKNKLDSKRNQTARSLQEES